MKALVLAEKPSVGKDIAKALGCRRQGNGFIEGDNYVVTWALGHLVTLADPEKYNARYKNWEMNDLPIMPEKLELVVIKQTSRQYETVKQQLIRKDVSSIIIATDAGREGELVARWILEKCQCRKPVKRLWISSVTDKAIKEGFGKLKDGKEYVNLYYSAQARAEADWLVGINATRCLTTKFNSQLSCGRVQTPTVALIALRDEEIKKFSPKKFYGVTAFYNDVRLQWQDPRTHEIRCFDEEKIKGIYDSVANIKEGTVVQLTKTRKIKLPPKLYDLTELQRDANKRFGFSPKETLDIMQALYERHKVLTYPRTDSRYISSDVVPTLGERIRACSIGVYAPLCKNILAGKISANNNFVDDKKVSDHHAIIPTEERILLSKLSDKEHKIYDLVVRRFLSVLYPNYEYEQVSVSVKIGKEFFTAVGQTVITAGFKAVSASYGDDEEDNEGEGIKSQALPKMNQGDRIPIKNIKITDGKTSPPPLYNEATLLSAMENPAKFINIENKGLAKTLGETGGLGTVVTRADIIDKLFNSFLIEKNGKSISITSKGRQLLKLVPKDLKSPELTGEWEQKLSLISKGQLKKEEFLTKIRGYTKEAILEIKQSTETFRHDNITGSRCPECNKYLLEVNGKKGKMLVCQDRECGYRQNISMTTNMRCPHCHKKLEIIGEGEKKQVYCVCGFREKHSRFIENMKASYDKMDRRQVQGYLDKVNADADMGNTALGDALRNLKF